MFSFIFSFSPVSDLLHKILCFFRFPTHLFLVQSPLLLPLTSAHLCILVIFYFFLVLFRILLSQVLYHQDIFPPSRNQNPKLYQVHPQLIKDHICGFLKSGICFETHHLESDFLCFQKNLQENPTFFVCINLLCLYLKISLLKTPLFLRQASSSMWQSMTITLIYIFPFYNLALKMPSKLKKVFKCSIYRTGFHFKACQ